MSQQKTTAFTAEGSRVHLNVLTLMLRGPGPKGVGVKPSPVVASCVVDEDGNVPHRFEKKLEDAVSSGTEYLRIHHGENPARQAAHAMGRLQDALEAGIKGEMLQAFLDSEVMAAPVVNVFAPGTVLEILTHIREVELLGFEGILPEPPVMQLLTQRLALATKEAKKHADTEYLIEQLSSVGLPNLAAHCYTDEELGYALPRDKDSMMKDFDKLKNHKEIASLGVLFLRAAPQGRFTFNRDRWGVRQPYATDVKMNMRCLSDRDTKPAHGLMAMVNFLTVGKYALDCSFQTRNAAPTAFMEAMAEAFPEVEFKDLAVAKVDTAVALNEFDENPFASGPMTIKRLVPALTAKAIPVAETAPEVAESTPTPAVERASAEEVDAAVALSEPEVVAAPAVVAPVQAPAPAQVATGRKEEVQAAVTWQTDVMSLATPNFGPAFGAPIPPATRDTKAPKAKPFNPNQLEMFA